MSTYHVSDRVPSAEPDFGIYLEQARLKGVAEERARIVAMLEAMRRPAYEWGSDYTLCEAIRRITAEEPPR